MASQTPRTILSTKDPVLKLMETLVSINSVFPHEQEVSLAVQQYLRSIGFTVDTVRTLPDRDSIVATFGTAERYLGFYGHLDTVPPAKDYERDPFRVQISDGIARGLGVCDMKGGVACILSCARFAAENNLPVKVVLGVDEEDISRGAHDLVDSSLLNDIGFLIVAETGQVVDFKQPVSVCYGRKGRIVFEILVRGKAAHAAEAHKGINAIGSAAALIAELERLEFPAHPRLGSSTLVLQEIEACADSFSVPDACRIRCSLLTSPGTRSEDFINKVSEIAKKLSIDAAISVFERPTPYGEAYEIDGRTPFLKKMEEEFFRPLNVAPIFTGSVADENIFANRLKIPVLTMGPIGAGDHTKDEWVNIASLELVAKLYEKALHNFKCAGLD